MTTPITKEPLYAEVHNVPDDYHFTDAELERIIAGDMFTPRQGAIMAREIQERRKAAMDAEPVGEVVLGEYDDCGFHPDARVACIAANGQADWENFKDGTRLYTAPPGLVAIDERAEFNAWNNDENLPIAGVGAKNAAWLAWQARAELGRSLVVNSQAVNAEPVADVVAWHKEGEERACDIRWRRFDVAPGPLFAVEHPVATVPTFDEWLEIRGNKPLGWVKDAMRESYDACRTAMLQAGNSPVIPEGWQLVPVEPTKEMIDAGWLHFMGTKNPSSKGTYKAMLAAAPQQERK